MLTIIPTIDVEAIRSLTRLGDFDRLILGKIGKESYGVPRILDVFSEHNIHGSFFVDFAEIGHSNDKFSKLNYSILEQGSDIQLHIHPQFCLDAERPLLRDYSFDEQRCIFEASLKKMRETTKVKPIAFRAGGYGANNATLEVMTEFGIHLDSSFFPNHRNCSIENMKPNILSQQGRVTEFPVTVFNNSINYKFGPFSIKQRTLMKKLDIDSCSLEELTLAVDALNISGMKYVTLFLHSYSLIKWNPTYTQFKPDLGDIQKLHDFIKYCKSKGYRFAGLSEVYNDLLNNQSKETAIAQIRTKRNILQSVNKLIRSKIRTVLRGK